MTIAAAVNSEPLARELSDLASRLRRSTVEVARLVAEVLGALSAPVA